MKTKLITLAVATALTSPFALANDAPSYNYVEIGYNNIDLGGSADADGYKLKGMVALGEYFLLLADYSDASGSFDGFGIDGNNFDISRTNYGLGGKYDLENGGSFYATYTFGNWDLDNGFDFDVDVIKVGYRHMVQENFELHGGLSSTEPEEGSSESGFYLGLAYGFAPNWSFTGDYESVDDVDEYSLGIRYSF